MTQNNYFASATIHSTFNLESNSSNIGMPNKLTFLFDRIFSSDEKMRSKNKFLLIFLQSLIQTKEISLLNRFLNDDALNDFHPSLLKSSLIITQNIKGLDSSARENIQQILDTKI